jgi:DNA polymerase
VIHLDTEVKAPFKNALNTLGLDNYARHPDTALLLVTWAVDDDPVQVWDTRERRPADLFDALRDPKITVAAQNAQFDRVVIRHKLIDVPIDRWYCTRARAYAHGLPGSLEDLSRIYKLGDAAKKDGTALIELFCEQGSDPDAYPVEWLMFVDYAIHDVEALRQLCKRLPDWNFGEYEQRVYHLDQRINDRGFAVDLDLAQKMIDASAKARVSLDARVQALTDGAIKKGTQRAAVKDWIASDTFALVDMRAETLRKALREATLTPEQREMIELRLLTAKSSTAKCQTAINTAHDGRIRYTVTYGGAGRIGRFSHKGFQPGNMPRPERKADVVACAIEALQIGCLDVIWGDEAMAVCADALRGLIVAAPGHKLLVADWSNIEGRMLAWYAGEEWKLQAYHDKDAGRGADFYRLLGQKMTGRDPESFTDAERQQMKGCELSMGYEGGVGAYINIANSYRLDLKKLAQDAPRTLSAEYIERGRSEYEWAVKTDNTHDLPPDIYAACAAYKHSWRDGCPATTQLWETLITAAKEAVSNPGKLFVVGKVKMAATADWLAIQLPSGRRVMFAKPKIETVVTRDAKGKETFRTQLTALKSPQWYREGLYGGLLANAITQGGCRDILVDAMLRLDAQGYPIVLHIHDEVIAEVSQTDVRTHESMIEEMTKLPTYLAGLPLTAAGYTTARYRKG